MESNAAANEVIDSFEAEMFDKTFKILSEFKTAEELAEFFGEQGISAETGNSQSCAIAEYVKQNMGV